MEKILINTANHDEQRIAVVHNGILNDYISLIPGQADRRGSIFKGIVDVVEPSLDACFVNIGDPNRKAFLQFEEIHEAFLAPVGADGKKEIGDLIKPGMPVLVKIVKDARAEKGPLLTTRFDLGGGDLVLIPYPKEAHLRISRQAEDADYARLLAEQDKLKLPDGMSLIIRSRGSDKKIAELYWQLHSYLLPFFSKVKEVYENLEKPGQIYDDHNVVNTCLREFFTPRTQELVCDEEHIMEEARQNISMFQPDLADRVRMVSAGEKLISDSLYEQLDALMSRKVSLPSGGELVIDITEALIAVDINSKRSRNQTTADKTAFKTNQEAAAEIARQLRLRNLSGLIIIDFIDMLNDNNKREIEQYLRRALRSDKARISVGTLSQYGLIEMTRQNIGRPLHEAHASICTNCMGTGRLPTVDSFARLVLNRVREIAISKKNVNNIRVEVPTNVATYFLNEHRLRLVQLQNDLDLDIIMLPNEAMHLPEFHTQIDNSRSATQRKVIKASYEFNDKTNPANAKYLEQRKKAMEHSPAALTSFKAVKESYASEKPAKDTTKDTTSNGFISMLKNLLPNRLSSANNEETNDDSFSRKHTRLPKRAAGNTERSGKPATKQGSRSRQGQGGNSRRRTRSGSRNSSRRRSSSETTSNADATTHQLASDQQSTVSKNAPQTTKPRVASAPALQAQHRAPDKSPALVAPATDGKVTKPPVATTPVSTVSSSPPATQPANDTSVTPAAQPKRRDRGNTVRRSTS